MREFQTMNTDEPEDGKPTAPDDFEDLLKQYNKPMQVSTEPAPEPAPAGDTFQEREARRIQDEHTDTGAAPVMEEKLGNPKYYQRGKKAGQLRPGYEVKEKMTITGDLLDSAMFLTLIDTIVPMLICLTNNSFSPIKVEPEKLMLSEKQKNQLEPIVAQVVKKLSLTADPVNLLLIALISMYGIGFWSLRIESKAEYDALKNEGKNNVPK